MQSSPSPPIPLLLEVRGCTSLVALANALDLTQVGFFKKESGERVFFGTTYVHAFAVRKEKKKKSKTKINKPPTSVREIKDTFLIL